MTGGVETIKAAEVVLPCTDLDETLAFFVTRLGFRVSSIFPADAPRTAVVGGHGVVLRLEREASHSPTPATLRLRCTDPAAFAGEGAEAVEGGFRLLAPNGTRVDVVEAEPPLRLGELRPSFCLARKTAAGWGSGRAGMLYRDLVPDRQGGRFIASHICIPSGGPVPDYVHFHKVRFQMIYVVRGWVKVVYEDQGEPFVMEAGDGVLQPPEIRHRVLESSDNLEVVEVGCPAEHATMADAELELPTDTLRPERVWSGQRFVRHQRALAGRAPWRLPGFEALDTGIGAATGGLAGARVVRPRAGAASAAPGEAAWAHEAEFMLWFILQGKAAISHGDESTTEELEAGDSVALPMGLKHGLGGCSEDLELLEVTLPAEVKLVQPA